MIEALRVGREEEEEEEDSFVFNGEGGASRSGKERKVRGEGWGVGQRQ